MKIFQWSLATVFLALFSSWPAHAQQRAIYLDFGGTVGVTTSAFGNVWNNMTNSSSLTNLLDSTGTATPFSLFIASGAFGQNGNTGGGGLMQPSQSLLGALATNSATGDYFFVSGTTLTFTLGSLDSSKTYNLTFFGTRETTESRSTRYTVSSAAGSQIATLVTSGSGVGDGNYNGNNDTLATFSGLSPIVVTNVSSSISFSVSPEISNFGYIGAMQIDVVPEPSTYALLFFSSAALAARFLRRRS